MGNFRAAAYDANTNQVVDPNQSGAVTPLEITNSGQLTDSTGANLNQSPIPGINRLLTSNGMYLGSAFPRRQRGATKGKLISIWGALQNSAGTVQLVQGDLNPNSISTNALKITGNVAISFGQVNPIAGNQAYQPLNILSGAFTAGVWVKNLSSRTLAFELRFYNTGASHNIRWNCAIDPGIGWQFITVSPGQNIAGGGWVASDAVAYCRVSQVDTASDGPWGVGDSILVGEVFVDCKTRPRMLITFDDGVSTQCARTPLNTAKVSGTAFVSSTNANVLTTAANHTLSIYEPLIFIDTAPTGLSLNTVYYVQTVPAANTFTLATDAALTTTATTTGFAGNAPYQYAGTQSRSCQEIVENYGFRGTLFIVPGWLGTTGKYGYGGNSTSYMTVLDVLQMWKDGWSVGSHSNTHPSNNENAGLRLLGPYGYFYSNTFDNLPASYLTAWSITSVTGRRRTTAGTQASPSVFTTENAHQMLINFPIMFTDVAPTGCQLGVTYYVASVPSSATYTLATDQGTLLNKVNNVTGAWAGTANYRYPGASNDDSAIYNDVVTCAETLKAFGITTAYKFFALPQGAADIYVRNAITRAGFQWVRGISGYQGVATIPIGIPSGGGLSQVYDVPGGWLKQLDAVQTDGTNTVAQNLQYIQNTITLGACGCSYHHGFAITNLLQLDRFCSDLYTQSKAGNLDVITADELAKELGF